jgi:hypothetical protein
MGKNLPSGAGAIRLSAPLRGNARNWHDSRMIVSLFLALCLAAGTAFWIWMLVDCANRESDQGNTKVVWVIIIVVANFIGALIYYFARRPQRWAELGR